MVKHCLKLEVQGVQEEFRRIFPDRDPPVKLTIWYNVKKYKRHGTSFDHHKGNWVERGRSITSEENIEAVHMLENKPYHYVNMFVNIVP